jgi:hypothetical protein
MLSAWSASFLADMIRISRGTSHRACKEGRPCDWPENGLLGTYARRVRSGRYAYRRILRFTPVTDPKRFGDEARPPETAPSNGSFVIISSNCWSTCQRLAQLNLPLLEVTKCVMMTPEKA